MYNNKDLTSMGLTQTQLRLALVHEKLVTCTKRTPEPLQALSAVYSMKSSAENEPQEEDPHEKTMGKRGTPLQNTLVTEVRRRCYGCNATSGVPAEGRSMAAFLSIFAKLPLTPRMNAHIALRRWWRKLILKAFSQRR